MSGDQAPRARPDFLPPDEGHPSPEHPAPEPAAGRWPPPSTAGEPVSRAGTWWNILIICAASALMVAAFLPWVRARVVVDAFGQTLTHDLGEAAGIEADSMVLAVPVLALTAIGMAFWGLIARDTRISSLTAVPAGLALLACALFLLRLEDAGQELPGESPLLPYDVTPAYGWYVAVASALLVLGFSLVRPLIGRRRPEPETAPADAAPADAADAADRTDQS